MNITETTDNVKNVFTKIEEMNTNGKLKFLMYVFSCMYNGQLNNKNIANPNLVEDDDLEIFDFESIGMANESCSIFIQYLLIIYNGYNKIPDDKKCIYDNGNIIGMDYEDISEIISLYEKLSFEEKLDIVSELFIRYDNDTYFEEKIMIASFGDNSGFDIARLIKKYKSKK